jgi:hypothetical protein
LENHDGGKGNAQAVRKLWHINLKFSHVKTLKPSNKVEVIQQPYTLEEIAAVFDGKIAFKEQIARAAERVRKIGLPNQLKRGK